jgi:hypothetical protein
MRTGHLTRGMLVAGILSIAIGGCGNTDTGGTTGPVAGSGGAAEGGAGGAGSGGVTATGGNAAGGTSGSGGASATGGTQGSGGAQDTGGAVVGTGGRGTGGRTTSSTGGAAGRSTQAAGGTGGTGGAGGDATGGLSGSTGGARMGGRTGAGGRTTSSTGGTTGGDTTAPGGAGGTGAVTGTGGTTGGKGGSTGSSTCTPSKAASQTVTGTGSHKVVIEMNSDPGIKCGTIYRPSDLGGAEKYPIFVWGEGGCSQSGTSNQAAMGEIASHGYFVVADGVASGTACSSDQSGKPFLNYITWAIAENDKSCSAYYQSLDTTKIASDGFSCGGLMSENVSGDPRFAAVGITSSGLFSADQALWKKIHTPFKILLGGSSDMAYTNGLRDYDGISALGIPIILFSKDGAGHGGDLNRGTGDFNTINLAWLNWQLKGDTGATGKAMLYGASCKYCTASGWEYKSANIQ